MISKPEQFLNSESHLIGQKTNFSNASFKGAKFVNFINTTDCKIPSKYDLQKDLPTDTNRSWFKRIFGYFYN